MIMFENAPREVLQGLPIPRAQFNGAPRTRTLSDRLIRITKREKTEDIITIHFFFHRPNEIWKKKSTDSQKCTRYSIFDYLKVRFEKN